MSNVKHTVKLGFVIVMVVFTIVFSGYVSKHEVIHSTVSYRTATIKTSIEVIPENNTPLSAPRAIIMPDTETIMLNCEYILD